jgi:hypothetical protein
LRQRIAAGRLHGKETTDGNELSYDMLVLSRLARNEMEFYSILLNYFSWRGGRQALLKCG